MQKEQIKTLVVNILTGGVVAGVIFAGYAVFIKKDSAISVSSVTSVAKIAEETALIGTEIDYTLRDLDDLVTAVENSNAVFNLPAFKNLKDFSVAIPKEPIGRTNPFVPTDWKIKMNQTLAPSVPIPTPSPASTQAQTSAPEVVSSQVPTPNPTLIVTPNSGI